jgi:UDP-N-acetylmuramoylalanine--D-glutamate ligase
MIFLKGLENKNCYVLGLGKSGESAANALLKGKARVYVWDDNLEKRQEFSLKFSNIELLDPSLLGSIPFDLLIASPGISNLHSVYQQADTLGIEVVCDIELLLRTMKSSQFIGITGTNGKSTTTALVGHLLNTIGVSCGVGGNIGIPALNLAPASCYVLELSSYQLDLLNTPVLDVAILLNFSPDHLDRYKTMENYITSKEKIFTLLAPQGIGVIGVDDPWSLALYEKLKPQIGDRLVPISGHQTVKKGIYVKNGILSDGRHNVDQQEMDVTHILNLQGSHNHQNLAAAFAATSTLYPSLRSEILDAFESYPGLAHRQERVAVFENVTFINDSKATNAESTIQALKAYDNIYLILGGRRKEGGDEFDLFHPFLSKIKHVFTIGESAQFFYEGLVGKLPVKNVGTLTAAVQDCFKLARRENAPLTVLLSPACASLDQFKNFEHRGDVFKETVQQILLQEKRLVG